MDGEDVEMAAAGVEDSEEEVEDLSLPKTKSTEIPKPSAHSRLRTFSGLTKTRTVEVEVASEEEVEEKVVEKEEAGEEEVVAKLLWTPNGPK